MAKAKRQAKKSAQRAGAKKTAQKKATSATRKRPSEKAMELAAKDRAKAGKACPKCGRQMEVTDADHKAGKVTYGCPACDGSPIKAKRAAWKAETDDANAKRAAVRKQRAAEAKARAAATPKAEPKPKKAKAKMSGLDAAAKVLAEAGKPMNCKAIAEQAIAKGYWSTNGQTPWATLYSAILRAIRHNPDEARFRKTGPGLFALAT